MSCRNKELLLDLNITGVRQATSDALEDTINKHIVIVRVWCFREKLLTPFQFENPTLSLGGKNLRLD